MRAARAKWSYVACAADGHTGPVQAGLLIDLPGSASQGPAELGMFSIDPETVLEILTTTRMPDWIRRTGTVMC